MGKTATALCLPVVVFQSIKLFVFNVSTISILCCHSLFMPRQFVGIKHQTMINLCISFGAADKYATLAFTLFDVDVIPSWYFLMNIFNIFIQSTETKTNHKWCMACVFRWICVWGYQFSFWCKIILALLVRRLCYIFLLFLWYLILPWHGSKWDDVHDFGIKLSFSIHMLRSYHVFHPYIIYLGSNSKLSKKMEIVCVERGWRGKSKFFFFLKKRFFSSLKRHKRQ